MHKRLVFLVFLLINKIKYIAELVAVKFFACANTGKLKKRFGGRRLLTCLETNQDIANKIASGEPFMAARYGTVESGVMIQGIAKNLGIIKKIAPAHLQCLYTNAGFFPEVKNDADALKFVELMIDKSQQVDLFGAMNSSMLDYLIAHVLPPKTKITALENLEPWYCDSPWSKALKGKKVLFIHPYEESIQGQSRVREKLFENTDILPEFELLTLKAVQTISDSTDARFSDWFEALDYMYVEAIKKDFDIAIIGCGAYGFPLAAMIKEAGKQAIHLGGATQLFWGIKGARWDKHPILSKLYNEYWIRPDNNERPAGSEKVEGGCYW